MGSVDLICAVDKVDAVVDLIIAVDLIGAIYLIGAVDIIYPVDQKSQCQYAYDWFCDFANSVQSKPTNIEDPSPCA
jgi:hypothetical protein